MSSISQRCEDAEAFGALYQKHYPVIFKRCLKSFHNIEDAEDAAQDVFVKAFSKLSQFRADSRFETWLYAITSNQIQDRNRKSRRRPPSESLEDFHTQKFDEPAGQLVRVQIQEAFGNIDESEKLLVRQIVAGVNTADIAENAGCKRRSVDAKLGKIRCKIYNSI